jgi:serine/threonine protein kinase
MLVMELGEYSLSSYKEIFQTTLTDKETITLIKDILLALKTVHQINIIHRDIKPQNIIVNTLDSKHPYKLTDFGVSAGNNARKCTYIGT